MTPGSADPCRAAAQHAAFVRTLRLNAAHIQELSFVHGAYDSVFVKDCAITIDGRALLASARHPQRRSELPARREELERLGLDVEDPLPMALEGGDVVVTSDLALLGYGLRSERGSTGPLARFLGVDVVPLELVDDRLYHLDTALSVLSDGTALYCPEAFSPRARRVLEALPFERIAVAPDEALRFATNVVELGDVIVTGTVAPKLAAELERRGRRVVYTPLDEFQRAGGSAACLVLPRYGRAIETPTTAILSTAA